MDDITQDDLEDVQRKLLVLVQAINLADQASINFRLGNYHEAFASLTDYHSFRYEHAEVVEPD